MLLDAEGEARWLLKDFDPLRPPGATALAEHLFGKGCIEPARWLKRGDGAHCFIHQRPRIYVRPGLSAQARRWVIFHEVAECHLAMINYEEGDAEIAAERIAAALVAPRESFLDALREHGPRFDRLARDFTTTETAAARRLGEVARVQVAVVAPTHVRLSGPEDEEFNWPPEPKLRELAKARTLPPEVRRVALTDDRRRRVLLVG